MYLSSSRSSTHRSLGSIHSTNKFASLFFQPCIISSLSISAGEQNHFEEFQHKKFPWGHRCLWSVWFKFPLLSSICTISYNDILQCICKFSSLFALYMDLKRGVEVHKSIVELKEAMTNLLSIVSSMPTAASISVCVIILAYHLLLVSSIKDRISRFTFCACFHFQFKFPHFYRHVIN